MVRKKGYGTITGRLKRADKLAGTYLDMPRPKPHCAASKVTETKRAAQEPDGPCVRKLVQRRLATWAAAETTGATPESAANLRARYWAAIRGNGSAMVAIARMRESVCTIPSVAIPSAVIRAGSIEAGPIVAVVPRACPNEHTTDEPLRSVVALRCAGIGIVGIVTIRAHRGRTDISGANANADPNRHPRVSGNRG